MTRIVVIAVSFATLEVDEMHEPLFVAESSIRREGRARSNGATMRRPFIMSRTTSCWINMRYVSVELEED